MNTPIGASQYLCEIFSTSPSFVPCGFEKIPPSPSCRDERAKHVSPARSQLLPVRVSLKCIHGEFINVAALSIQNPTRLADSCRRAPRFSRHDRASGTLLGRTIVARARVTCARSSEHRNKPRLGSFLLLS